MCGITGIAGFRDPDLVRRMTATLRHRGPDEEGFRFSGTVSLGHRRLSIIDLEQGQQPMASRDGSVWVSFNGQIYNHLEIRRLLGDRYPFRTRCDTEILPALYQDEGIGMIDRLRGMFSFALHDEREETLYLVRDRLGIKPLYYSRLGTRLLFASEPKALLQCSEVSREVDEEALVAYLKLLYVPPPLSMFRGIRQLPPGHYLRWRNGEISIHRYWTPPCGEEEKRSIDEWAEEIEPVLRDAIRMRLMSDVPLGAFLSGGIDSSTIVSIMAENGGTPVRTFCVGFGEEGKAYEERPVARRVAEYFGTDHHEIEIRLDVPEALGEMVRGFDEPFGNPTAMLSSELARFTHREVTVALAGDGGDEVFGGYPRYQGMLLSEWVRRIPRRFRSALLVLAGTRESSTARNYRRWFRQLLEGADQVPSVRYSNWVGYRTDPEVRRILHPDRRARFDRMDPVEFVEKRFREPETGSPVARSMYADLCGFLPENVLRYTDRMSMAHSLEVRVPFTDHVLVERTMSVPDRFKVTRTASKRILRKIMKDRLPQEVIHRKKLGFNPPMGIWLQEDSFGLLNERLNPDRVRQRGVFDSEEVQRLIAEHRAGVRDWGLQIWSLIVFEEWLQSVAE